MKKTIIVLFLITMLCFTLGMTACGGNPTTDSPDSNITNPTGDSENPEPSKTSYVITFNDENGNLLESKEWSVNDVPSYNYEKQDTAEWDYTFQGWSKTKGGSTVTVEKPTKDCTYYAVITSQKQKYTISFFNETGEKLSDSSFDYGTVPSYLYNKQDTAEWDYTVDGWSNLPGGEKLSSLPTVNGNASYYALISKVKQKYTLTFNSNGGSNVTSITKEYNSSISAPSEPIKDGYAFVSWCTDSNLSTAVSWPITITSNKTVYAKWNEKVDLKSYINALVSAREQDPYSFIPESMRPTYTQNHVSASAVTYDFSDFVNVSSINYGGYGEQWQMIIDNIQESEKFFTVLTLADTVITSSVATFNNWFDSNPSSTNKSIDETGYFAKVDYENGVLSYTIQLKTKITIPLFGELTPQIDMTYDISTKEKAVRINLSETNAMRYVISDDKYLFGIEYGLDGASRSAYCQLTRDNNGDVEGHIYEYITLKDKDAVKSCADFYIDDTYVSIVGNKASGIIGMNGYINELYKISDGKLLGYKVKETKTIDFPIIGEITSTYHTLWFNLNSISGITSVKVLAHTGNNENKYNSNDVYVNGSSNIFAPTYNKQGVSIAKVKTSRKYDIEMRTRYFYGIVNNELTKYEVQIPMMFIQDDHDEYTNYSDFVNDIKTDDNITASVNLSGTYLTKIREDYDELIPVFITNKELVDSTTIKTWIGSVVE